MFSQWRHAVESLAQSPRSSQDASNEEAPVHSSVDGMRTSLSSSSHLAESALNNLRKTLAAQRPASPGLGQTQTATSPSNSESVPAPAPKPRTAGRSTLEDRLRAKFAIGDVSGTTSPAGSGRATPSPVSVADHPLALTPSSSQDTEQDIRIVKGPADPLSPASTPLPDSPLASPTTEAPTSLNFVAEPPSEYSASPEALDSSPSADEERTDPPTSGSASVNQCSAYPPKDPPLVEVETSTSPEPETITILEGEPIVVEVQERSEPTLVPESDSEPESPVPPPIGEPESSAPIQSSDNAASELQTEDSSCGNEETPASATSESFDTPTSVFGELQPSENVASIDSPQVAVDGDNLQVDPITHPTDPGASQVLAVNGKSLNSKDTDSVDIEALQKRLKLVEQRFTDVSTSFKRLQAEKVAADRVLRELTSVESVTEAEALRDFLQNMNIKNEMAQDEIRRLSGKLTRQEERIEELRDIHHLESKSQSDQIDKLKAQVEEAEKLVKATQGITSQTEEESTKRQAEIDRLRTELSKANTNAKDEEEKRTKAIALLKTVRQKLVKAEKDRDDAIKEVSTLKEAEKVEREKEKMEKTQLQSEIEKANAERETAMLGLRMQFEKEVAVLREKHEKELIAMRSQFELEAITAKTTHVREIENKKARISDLESTVKTISSEKDEFFDQVQLRQAELESLQSSLESLQGQNTELQYQLREASDRLALLQEEFSDARREQDLMVQPSGPSTEDVTRLLAAAEAKHEMKLSDLRRRLAEAERERDEGEAHWSRKLTERTREVESLKAVINSSQQSKEAESESAQVMEGEIEALKGEIRSYQKQVIDLNTRLQKAAEVEVAAKHHLADLSAKTANLQQDVDEAKNREAQLRNQNKTLREELRKVQSSVALLEKQRGPGVGYWASRNGSSSELRSPTSSVSDLTLRSTPPRSGTPSVVKSDEEVNFEYLRNVIMQFLEHKERRPHLVRILSTILRFTPEETRQLVAKV